MKFQEFMDEYAMRSNMEKTISMTAKLNTTDFEYLAKYKSKYNLSWTRLMSLVVKFLKSEGFR